MRVLMVQLIYPFGALQTNLLLTLKWGRYTPLEEDSYGTLNKNLDGRIMINHVKVLLIQIMLLLFSQSMVDYFFLLHFILKKEHIPSIKQMIIISNTDKHLRLKSWMKTGIVSMVKTRFFFLINLGV